MHINSRISFATKVAESCATDEQKQVCEQWVERLSKQFLFSDGQKLLNSIKAALYGRH